MSRRNGLLAIGQLQQHRSVTKLVQRAPGCEIVSAQRHKKIGLRCKTLCKVGSESRYGGRAVQLRADSIRIAKRRRPVDLDGIWRQPPSFGALQLDTNRHCSLNPSW